MSFVVEMMDPTMGRIYLDSMPVLTDPQVDAIEAKLQAGQMPSTEAIEQLIVQLRQTRLKLYEKWEQLIDARWEIERLENEVAP